jgi:hypothetical protein
MTENEIGKIIVDSAVEVHRELGGPGMLENVYEEALAEELKLKGLLVERMFSPSKKAALRVIFNHMFFFRLRHCVKQRSWARFASLV